MMTPINRIPQLDSEGKTLAAIVNDELEIDGEWDIPSAFLNSIVHDKNEESLSCMMDWAMQIRAELGISWGASIRAASILYYG